MRLLVPVLLCALLAVRCFAQSPTADSAPARIAELRAAIAHHDDLYYRQAAPEISDFAYDELQRELAELERAFPEVAKTIPHVPAHAASDDRSGAFPTRAHEEPMLSLDKTYSPTELRAWHAKLARTLERPDLVCVIEPKVDGIAINVTFERGELVHAVTRGNGLEGDDITANVLTIPGLPRQLATHSPEGAPNPIPERIELRGEVFLTFAEFERINHERADADEPLFANPRNAAAGSAKLTDPEQAAARRLSIVFYGWGRCEPLTMRPATQHDFARQLQAWGLPALEPSWRVSNIDEMREAVERFGRTRVDLPYPTDGCVIKLDDVSLREVVGASPVAPRWALAFKYAPDRVETQLRAITIQVGRTGLLTPVAELAPVEISGSTVTRASLHNRALIAQRDIRVGDFVYVEKAGQIIPTIVGVNLARRAADSRPFVFPHDCPACHHAVASREGEAAIRCANPACPEQLRRRLEHFASAAGVNIEGLGPATVDALVTRGRVKNIADLYRLQRADLQNDDESSTSTADKLLNAIQRSKSAELWRFIHGLSIPGIGAMRARDLARRFRSLDALARATPEDFAASNRSSSPATTAAVLAHFADPQNRALVRDLLALGIRPTPPPIAPTSSTALTGKVFVLTGRLPHLTRTEALQHIEAAGGIVSDHVSRRTDYLVAGENPGAKLPRARELDIPIIDEAELRRMLSLDP